MKKLIALRLSILIALLVGFLSDVRSQSSIPKVPLVNSGEVINQANILYDSSKYKEAIEKYLTVPKRDTNYVYMLTELALTYHADSSYDKAIATCDEALKYPSIHRAHLMRTRAIALDKKGEYEASVKAFKEAIEKYPFNHSLYFNLGITYFNHKEFDLAQACFFKTLSINPFHGGSHLNLASLAIGARRRTHAMLAMGAYLSVNNEDNRRLVSLNSFLGNELDEEPNVTLSGKNGCEKLDQLIKAGIAMEKKFETRMPLSAPVVRQFELFFKQINSLSAPNDNQWLSYYLPYYKALVAKELDQAYLYHILTSSTNEDVKKWLKKNDKTLNAFYSLANEELKKNRLTITAPKSFGYDAPVQASYGSNYQLEALGAFTGTDNRQGQWYYFHDNSELSASGKYSSNKKIGIWKYYNENGTLRSVQNNDTGEMTFYYENGAIEDQYKLVDGKVHGLVQSYYDCGAAREKINYENGKRQGSGEIYHPSGAKSISYVYKDDKLTGDYILYHDNGQISSTEQFVEGVPNGQYREFYSNGKPYVEGETIQGKKNGVWKYYYRNGKLERTGQFKEDLGIGEWLYYDHYGQLTEKRNFNDKGDWNGESTQYYEGKPYVITTYKNNLLIKVEYKDASGKLLGSFGDPSGSFASKTYFFNGQLAGEGAYKKGEVDGKWVYYFPDGTKRKEHSYSKGLMHGAAVEYFNNGAKKYALQYEEGKLHGYYQEFFIHGKVKTEGWFQKGERQQQWLSYYSTGSVESDNYYLNDQLEGEQYDYSSTGRLTSIVTYKTGKISDITGRNDKGENKTVSKTEGSKRLFETRFENGKPKVNYEVTCGKYSGNLTHWYPDGHEFYTMSWSNGVRQKSSRSMTTDNYLEWGGRWEDGNKIGVWEERNSVNQLESRGRFFNDSYDSTWTYYFITGTVSSYAPYRYDEREGITEVFSTDGTPIVNKRYESGLLVAYRVSNNGQWGDWQPVKSDMIIKATFPGGGVAYEETFKNGLQTGTRRIYYKTGKPYSEFGFQNGDYEGPYTIYHPNGTVAESGNHVKDELTGTRKYFAEDGTVIKTEEFMTGVAHGKFITYKAGKVVNEVVFFGGEPEY